MTIGSGELWRYVTWLLLLLAVAALLLRLAFHEQFGWIPVGTSAALVVTAIALRITGNVRGERRKSE